MSAPPLRARALVAGAIGLPALLALATIARASLQLGDYYMPKAALGFMAMMALAIAFIRGRHPYPRLGAANHVTIVRAMLVALMAGLIGEPATTAAAASAAVASTICAVLDGMDGWLARRHQTLSEFGARFDMEIDALLVLVLSALTWQYGKAGAWVLLCGLMRYLFVGAGWVLPWMRGPLSPTLRARTVAVVQMVGLALAVSPTLPAPLSTLTAAVTLATLGWSFATDVGRLWRAREDLNASSYT